MSVMDSKGTLAGALKDLFARWNDVKVVWSDAQSQAFENEYLIPIEQDVRGALSALDQMNQVMQMIENDCE